MTTNTPLVVIAGQARQLPSGNALGGITGGTATGEALVYGQSNAALTSAALTTPDIGAANGTSLTLTGALQVDGNTTLGNASGDTLTINPNTWTIPNGIGFVKTAQSSVAEQLISFKVSDDAVGSLTLANSSSADGVMAPQFVSTHPSNGAGMNFTGRKTTDSGTAGAILFVAQTAAAGALGTSPCHEFRNLSTAQLIITASHNVTLKGGSTSPALDAASADTVAMVGVDNGAGNRELQIQPESGGYLAYGADVMRRVPNANRDWTSRVKTITTTNNTQTTLDTIAIMASSTYLIESRIVARRTGGSAGTADDGATYVRRGSYTTKSGTVTLLGVEVIGTDREDQAGWDVTLDINGTDVRVRVTGATNNNISWQAETTVQRISS